MTVGLGDCLGERKMHPPQRNFWYSEVQHYCRLPCVCTATRSCSTLQAAIQVLYPNPHSRKARQNTKDSTSRTQRKPDRL